MNPRTLAGVTLFAFLSTGLAQKPAAAPEKPALPATTSGAYSLDQFGPIGSPADAEKAFQKASEDIIAAGGGVLFIPDSAAKGWQPKNNTQDQWRKPPPPATAKNWGSNPGVTVIDARGSTMRILPPQVNGLSIERTLNLPQGQSLPHWGYYPAMSIKNTILHGSTSYHDWLQEDVAAGVDRRFYVATIRGIFPGEFLNGLSYSGGVPRLYIKSLGYDKEKKAWFFVADTELDIKKGALLSNKNHTNVLSMETFSHNENQTFDVRMWRHNYSQGDNYLFDARFKYMGDVHSTAGDENGVIYAAFVEQELGIFKGKVESWNPETGELKYKGGPKGDTLGSGRPFINMNPAKWITKGTALLVNPGSWTDSSPSSEHLVWKGKAYPTVVEKNPLGINALRMGGLIRLSADAPVSDEMVGRYFAVDEPDELVPKANLHRWFLIDRVTANADGTKDIKVIRHWWGAKPADGLKLYKPENYSWDGREKQLHYVIAPGANAYDVSDGVDNPKRTVKLVPTSFAGTAADFAPDDAVEQAIGPDPFKPIPFRSWIWDNVPGAFPASCFDIANHGAIMRDSMFWVHGGSGDIEKEKETHYDRNPSWDKIFTFEAASNIGIRFGADTGTAALLFTQPNDRVQPIKWYYGADKESAPKIASLTVSTDAGQFNFSGGSGVKVDGPVMAKGLSGDDKPSRNLRGKNIAVKAGQTSVEVAFPTPETDEDFAVFVEQSWITNRAIVKKAAGGFTVQFEKPAPEGAKLDWMLVR
jgi:hypothetical protein